MTKIGDFHLAQFFAAFAFQAFFRGLAWFERAARQNQQRCGVLFVAEQYAPLFQIQQACFVIVRQILLQDRKTFEILGHKEAAFRYSRGSLSL